jgi:hypothetical protein
MFDWRIEVEVNLGAESSERPLCGVALDGFHPYIVAAIFLRLGAEGDGPNPARLAGKERLH